MLKSIIRGNELHISDACRPALPICNLTTRLSNQQETAGNIPGKKVTMKVEADPTAGNISQA